jgi:hypothetical protein
VHVKAWKGSGGVGFLVKNQLFDGFKVNVCNDETEGILWLKMTHKFDNFCMYACVCYLPPKFTTRQVDVNGFYDALLSNIYEFQDCGTIFVCGDFNSRTGNLSDFIEGVDEVPERTIVDATNNEYGSVMIDFLINTNYCMLNGRNCINNDFTCVRTQGMSVVDYCLVNHNDLDLFKGFQVIRSSELVNTVGITPVSVPDHSVISWNIILPCSLSDIRIPQEKARVVFDVREMTDSFLSDTEVVAKLHATVFSLESSMRAQSDIDNAYAEICMAMQKEMSDRLPRRKRELNSFLQISTDGLGSRGGTRH